MKFLSKQIAIALTSTVMIASASAQPPNAAKSLPETARTKISQAEALAGDDPLMRTMRNYHCYYVDPVPAPFRPAVMDTTDFLFGTKIADNVYYLGYLNLAAYAIQTSEGLVLVDAGGSEAHGKKILEWMTSAGFAPNDLKWIIITHEHFDHFGGAPYLKAQTGAKVVSGAGATFGENEALKLPTALQPLDLAVKERTTLKVGNTELVILSTPGHTEGTLSIFSPIQVNGAQHMASFWGGKGMRPNASSIKLMLNSLKTFNTEADRLNVDVPLNTHSWGDATISRTINLILDPKGPNPFVMTNDQVRKNNQILELCTSAYLDAVESGAITRGHRD